MYFETKLRFFNVKPIFVRNTYHTVMRIPAHLPVLYSFNMKRNNGEQASAIWSIAMLQCTWPEVVARGPQWVIYLKL